MYISIETLFFASFAILPDFRVYKNRECGTEDVYACKFTVLLKTDILNA